MDEDIEVKEVKVGDFVKMDIDVYRTTTNTEFFDFLRDNEEYIEIIEECPNLPSYFRLAGFTRKKGSDNCMFSGRYILDVAKKIKDTKIARKLNKDNIFKEEKGWIYVKKNN